MLTTLSSNETSLYTLPLFFQPNGLLLHRVRVYYALTLANSSKRIRLLNPSILPSLSDCCILKPSSPHHFLLTGFSSSFFSNRYSLFVFVIFSFSFTLFALSSHDLFFSLSLLSTVSQTNCSFYFFYFFFSPSPVFSLYYSY